MGARNDRTKVELMGPSRPVLAMDLPMSFGDGIDIEQPSGPACCRRSRQWLCRRLPSEPPSITCATCSPSDPNSRAMACATPRNSALAAANDAKRLCLRTLPLAPEKIIVPHPNGTNWRAASRPSRKAQHPRRHAFSKPSAENG
jgi:hypothetical protein